MSAELEKARKMVNSLAKLEEEYGRLNAKWRAAQKLLPQEQEVADLLRKVTRAGSQSGDNTQYQSKHRYPFSRRFSALVGTCTCEQG